MRKKRAGLKLGGVTKSRLAAKSPPKQSHIPDARYRTKTETNKHKQMAQKKPLCVAIRPMPCLSLCSELHPMSPL